jgi:hypothetical protein
MYLTQNNLHPVSTPRGYVSSLFVPVIRTRLVRSFHAAFTECEIRKSQSLRSLESVLLNNACPPDILSPLNLLSRALEACLDVTVKKVEFSILLLNSCPQTDCHKSGRIEVRNFCLRDDRLEPCLPLLTACHFDGISDQPLSWLLNLVQAIGKSATAIQAVIRVISTCTESDLIALQRSETRLNVFLALSDVCLAKAGEEKIHHEGFEQTEVRTLGMNAISLALSVTVDPVGLMSLRKDASDQTIAQRAFLAMFEELFQETYFREKRISYSNQVTNLRVQRLVASTSIVTRVAALYLEQQFTSNPLEEFSVLIPSLFGLIKGLLGSQSELTVDFDIILNKMIRGDLLYIKELGLPELVGTCFEMETSLWPSKSSS